MDVHIAHRPGQLQYNPITGWNHTASIDWCEDNYVHSKLLAEFWNCLSNIPFIVLALYGAWATLGLPNRTRYVLSHLGIATVGVGSFIFHATLNWHAQVLLDELPMIWVSSMALYCILADGRPSGGILLKLLCIAIPAGISAVYLVYPNPLLHQFAYGFLQLLMAYRVKGLLARLSPKFREGAQRLMIEGVLFTVLAFAIWNLDNVFCDHLTAWRRADSVPYLGKMLSEGHAWWHILSAIGCNRTLTAVTGIVVAVNDDNYEFAQYAGILPYVRQSDKPQGDAEKQK